METLKQKMEAFRTQCHFNMSRNIQMNPGYLNSTRHAKDINNNRIIWQCVDDLKKIKNHEEHNTWAKDINKKIDNNIPIQWEIIDQINKHFKFNSIGEYTSQVTPYQ